MKRVLVALGALVLLTVASAQELRAWRALNFGDSPDTVRAKIEALQDEGHVIRHDGHLGELNSRWLSYTVPFADMETNLRFDFYDNKLYRLRFSAPTRTASYFHTTVMDEAATLRQVMRGALGNPNRSYDLRFFDMQAGYVMWSDVWKSGGVTRYVGIGETRAQYYAHLRIEWDWMVNFIAQHEGQERDQSIQDASEGF